MTEPHDPERLRALEERIAKAKGALEPKTSRGEEHFSMANMAWRMVVELVAGLVIGLGMGWGLDKLLGTTPIFLVLFIGFGFAAGMKTVLRTAEEVNKQNAVSTDKDATDERD